MNKENVNERDMILFGEPYDKAKYQYGGVRHFSELTAEELKELVDKDFIDLEECQNCSPTTQDFMEFLEEHPEFTAHGYAVSPERSDYRITLEGIKSEVEPDMDILEAFIEFCRFADDFSIHPLYAWWD